MTRPTLCVPGPRPRLVTRLVTRLAVALVAAVLVAAVLVAGGGRGAWAQSAPAVRTAVPAVASGAAATGREDAAAFIRRLGHQAAGIAADRRLDPAGRKAALARLLAAGIDVRAIGKFALGRYWRAATPAQRKDYLDVFGRYLVSVYAERLAGQGGRELEVLGAQDDGGTVMVHSRFVQDDGNPPLRLDWKLDRGADGFHIVDVLVDDLSMAITQRSDFTGALERNHGSLQALIDALKTKVAAG